MSALPRVAEPAARYLAPAEPPLLAHFDLLATAPDGVARLRELILSLAVRGKLVPQDPKDEPASVLLARIRKEKDCLIAGGKIKRGKPLAPIEDDEQPFELPNRWEWVRLGNFLLELCTGPFGSMVHKEDYVSGGVPLINPSHMIDGRIVPDPEVAVGPDMAKRLDGYRLSDGDILLARRGEVGRYAIVTGQEAGWLCGTGSFFVKLKAECNRDFMGLVFENPALRRELQGESVGSTMTNLNQRILLETVFAVPPAAEQSRIVARVEALMKLCDQLEARGRLEAEQHARLVGTLFDALAASESAHALAENWQRVAACFDLLLDRIEAVDALEQTILQLAVRGLLVPLDPADEPASRLLEKICAEKDRLIAAGKIKRDKPLPPITKDEKPFELPEAWDWVRVNTVSDIAGGIQKTPARTPRDNHYPYLRVANVQRGRLVLDEIERFELFPEELVRWRLQRGDLLVVEGNGSEHEVGRCALWQGEIEDCVHQNHLIRIRPTIVSMAKFILLFLNSEYGRAEMKRLAITTSGLFNLSVGKIQSIALPVPPLAEQSRIVARVEELRRLCTALRERLMQSREVQTRLADTLVSDLRT